MDTLKKASTFPKLFGIISLEPPTKSIFVPWASSNSVQLTTGEGNREYAELGIICATSSSYEGIHEELQKKAQEIGADAVIRITYKGRHAIGTAVRYIDSAAAQPKK